MNIRITPAAQERMRAFTASDLHAVGVRFGVRKAGCSGYAYTIDVAHEVRADDSISEQEGFKLIVDAKSMPFVEGSEIDFVRQGLNTTFVFINPNATAACGCGESFHVESAA